MFLESTVPSHRAAYGGARSEQVKSANPLTALQSPLDCGFDGTTSNRGEKHWEDSRTLISISACYPVITEERTYLAAVCKIFVTFAWSETGAPFTT